ncbi:MAG: cytidine deaminase [Spirulina sp. DLM2.Bin59]|nr:MAG: cytidine deaminase [Spirulina sp. DLM2.Bin59]
MQYLRPTWDEYFLMFAKLAATRSTCLSFPVGAIIVKDRQILATGYNGPPSGSPHCTEQGFCYEGLETCASNQAMHSRAVHAEANAIAQAAKHGISTENAIIYVTLEPCLSCLKLIIAAGIKQVYYETQFPGNAKNPVIESFYDQNLVISKEIKISHEIINNAVFSLSYPTSVVKNL